MRPIALCAALSTVAAACGGSTASSRARAVVDTLPGGIPRVTSAGPTAWADSAGARLVEVARFSGEDGTPAEIGQPQSLAADDGGRAYVVDTKPAVIKVFSPQGTLVRTIGGEGEGPGEFRAGFIAVRGRHLVLHDPEIGRTSVWDTSGTFLRSWRTSCCYWGDIQIDQQDRVYVPSIVAREAGAPSRGTAYVRWSTDGSAIDTAWVPRRDAGKYWTVSILGADGKPQMSKSTPIPFLPGNVSALHPGGGVVYGWTGAYSLVRSASGTDTARMFGRAWAPEAIADDRRTAVVEARIRDESEGYGEENARRAFNPADVPGTLPAFSGLRVDESGRIWVRRHAVALADTARTAFEVFDPAGAYLGPVTVPLQLPEYGLQAWTRDGLVAIVEDDDGRPTIVRFRFILPPNGS